MPATPAPPAWPSLAPRYDLALREAVTFVRERFAPAAIIASGTILRGTPDPASDLDLYVVHHQPWRQRLQRYFGDGVPAEIFVNSPASIERYLAEEQAEGRPVTAHMLATGTVVFTADDAAAALVLTLRARAEGLLAAPPPPLGERQRTTMRYGPATLYEDAVDVADRDPAAAALLLARAVAAMLDYHFRARGECLPRPKDLFATLDAGDPTLATLAREALFESSIQHRLDAGRRLAEATIGATGFFEWESERG